MMKVRDTVASGAADAGFGPGDCTEPRHGDGIPADLARAVAALVEAGKRLIHEPDLIEELALDRDVGEPFDRDAGALPDALAERDAACRHRRPGTDRFLARREVGADGLEQSSGIAHTFIC